jgi:hypothetical protein
MTYQSPATKSLEAKRKVGKTREVNQLAFPDDKAPNILTNPDRHIATRAVTERIPSLSGQVTRAVESSEKKPATVLFPGRSSDERRAGVAGQTQPRTRMGDQSSCGYDGPRNKPTSTECLSREIESLFAGPAFSAINTNYLVLFHLRLKSLQLKNWQSFHYKDKELKK